MSFCNLLISTLKMNTPGIFFKTRKCGESPRNNVATDITFYSS